MSLSGTRGDITGLVAQGMGRFPRELYLEKLMFVENRIEVSFDASVNEYHFLLIQSLV